MKDLMSQDMELRKVPSKHTFSLAQILEVGQGWKQLMAIIPNTDNPPHLKFTVENMRTIEEASSMLTRSCSEILLDEWGTSGRMRPRLRDLVPLLTKAQLYRAAEYVSFNMLNEPLLERPSEGPAAKVEIPDFQDCSHEPSAPNEESLATLVEPCAPPESTSDTIELLMVNSTSLSVEYTGQCDVTRCLNQNIAIEKEDLPAVRSFGYDELLQMTNHFNPTLLLGRGGFGQVYLAQSTNGSLAVKKLLIEGAAVPNLINNQFRNELLIVSGLNHFNILKLIGYSCDGPDLCLVYPYMANGSLEDRLECKGGTAVLPWILRLQIALDTAKGLLYLHSFTPKPLVHRDVKSANVLLDQDFHVKVADFGLMRHGSSGMGQTVALTSNVLGTSAYMAPEAFRGDVSLKMDVFSFGIVLLELITGLPPFDESRSGCDLASHVDEVDDLEVLIDKRPQLDDIRPVRALYDLAQSCLLEKKQRPPISRVLDSLKNIAH